MMFLLLACSVADGPSCLTEEMHSCPTVEVMHSCNEMFAFSGLHVDFVGGTIGEYDAVVSFDGREESFHCGEEGATEATTDVWSCDGTGFFLFGTGDHVDLAVISGDESWTASYEPCWDPSEPNGECCGWQFDATVELEIAAN